MSYRNAMVTKRRPCVKREAKKDTCLKGIRLLSNIMEAIINKTLFILSLIIICGEICLAAASCSRPTYSSPEDCNLASKSSCTGWQLYQPNLTRTPIYNNTVRVVGVNSLKMKSNYSLQSPKVCSLVNRCFTFTYIFLNNTQLYLDVKIQLDNDTKHFTISEPLSFSVNIRTLFYFLFDAYDILQVNITAYGGNDGDFVLVQNLKFPDNVDCKVTTTIKHAIAATSTQIIPSTTSTTRGTTTPLNTTTKSTVFPSTNSRETTFFANTTQYSSSDSYSYSNTSSPSQLTVTPASSNVSSVISDSADSSKTVGAIVGAVIAVLIIIVVCVVVLLLYRRKGAHFWKMCPKKIDKDAEKNVNTGRTNLPSIAVFNSHTTTTSNGSIYQQAVQPSDNYYNVITSADDSAEINKHRKQNKYTDSQYENSEIPMSTIAAELEYNHLGTGKTCKISAGGTYNHLTPVPETTNDGAYSLARTVKQDETASADGARQEREPSFHEYRTLKDVPDSRESSEATDLYHLPVDEDQIVNPRDTSHSSVGVYHILEKDAELQESSVGIYHVTGVCLSDTPSSLPNPTASSSSNNALKKNSVGQGPKDGDGASTNYELAQPVSLHGDLGASPAPTHSVYQLAKDAESDGRRNTPSTASPDHDDSYNYLDLSRTNFPAKPACITDNDRGAVYSHLNSACEDNYSEVDRHRKPEIIDEDYSHISSGN